LEENYHPILTLHSFWYVTKAAFAALAFVAVWMYYGIKFFTWYDSEKIIKYAIDVPNPPGDGTPLEKPSIKVRLSKVS
jgi:hypothetical protein